MKYCVMYAGDVVIIVEGKENVSYNKSNGWKVFGYANSQEELDIMVENACR